MIAAVALVAVGAGVGRVVFGDGIVYPDHWDRRVAGLASFVEMHRGHTFRHPVQVYFLAPERYREIAGGGADQPEPTAKDKENSAHTVAEYRSLGLMQGAPDLDAASETLLDSGTLAFYSPVNHVVNVRGTEITPAVRVTLVHELTHAMQDQYFDLSAIADATTADASGAARAVVEGDAVSVENEYVAQMSDADRASYEAESKASGKEANTDLANVPAVLQVLFGSYYAVGNAFVEFWQAEAGGTPRPDRIDEVLRRLPSGSDELFEPGRYPESPARPVNAPALPRGEKVFERSTHGVDLLFVMLAERIDPRLALTATDGWNADTYVASLGANDRMCVRSRVAFRGPSDADEFRLAITAWSQSMPPEAGVAIDPASPGAPSEVGFMSCDAGPGVDMKLTGQAGPALGFPVTRLQAAASAVSKGRSREQGLCYGEAVISRLTVADMAATATTPAIQSAIDAAAADCP